MSTLNLLALDYGASNGRGILGKFDGAKVELSELHRFENQYVPMSGRLHWNFLHLHASALACFEAAAAAGVQPDAFGIDTWGVDYGLLDKNGELISEVRSYRDMTNADMPPAWDCVPKRRMFDLTGIAHHCFNSVYQLHRRKREGDVGLELAKTMLMLPDLLAYFLTGEVGTEYTAATTSMLYNPIKRGWDGELIDALGLPHIFTEVEMPGRLRGKLTESLATHVNLKPVPFAVVGEHDTASAVAAIPGKGNFAFCSSGTWSLFGVETDEPKITDTVFEANFANEGTVQGGFRPLRNIMGLWIIQECRREWIRQGENLSWNGIVLAASGAPELASIINSDSPEFFSAGNMIQKIQSYCRQTGQKVPETIGEISRCVYESLALKYRKALGDLEEIKGEPLTALQIVGGGIQNKLLNQMIANSIGRPVVTGPIEGAAMGNVLMQAVALGELSGIEDVRRVVAQSCEIDEYAPHRSQRWDDAYDKLLGLMKMEVEV